MAEKGEPSERRIVKTHVNPVLDEVDALQSDFEPGRNRGVRMRAVDCLCARVARDHLPEPVLFIAVQQTGKINCAVLTLDRVVEAWRRGGHGRQGVTVFSAFLSPGG